MVQNPFAIQFAERISRGGNRRAADEAEMRIAGGFELRIAFLCDALDVAQRDQPAQMIFVVHDEQFMNAEMFGEKCIGAGDGIFAEFFLIDGLDLGAGRERF